MSEEIQKRLMLLVAIRDSKADNFNSPTAVYSEAVAIRMFADLCKDTQTMIGQHPADFELWLVGSYDTDDGAIYPRNHKICDGSDFGKEVK